MKIKEQGTCAHRCSSLLKKISVLILITILVPSLIAPAGAKSIYDPYYTKAQKLEMWKTLFSRPNCSSQIVGYTYLNKPIYAFTCGNPAGGRVLWDAEIHGSEENGGMILYLLAEWLVTSNSSTARSILKNNYIMFVPIVNYDSTTRDNANLTIGRYGVDLNRNFFNGWAKGNKYNDTYPGPNPGSEPETRVLRSLFERFKPTFYTNLHVGTGPVILYYRESNSTIVNQVFSNMTSLSSDLNVSSYPTHAIGSDGYAIGDAYDLGIPFTCMIEAVGRNEAWIYTSEVYQKLVTVYEPKCRALFIAQCQFLGSPDGISADGDVPVTQDLLLEWWIWTLFVILVVSVLVIKSMKNKLYTRT